MSSSALPTFAKIKASIPTAATTANRLRDSAQERELLKTIAERIASAEPGDTHVTVSAMSTTAKAVLSAEQRLILALPERSIEKTYHKVRGQHGRWENRLIPTLQAAVWQEFLEEHLGPALQRARLPVINTRELKAGVDRRAREFALGYVHT